MDQLFIAMLLVGVAAPIALATVASAHPDARALHSTFMQGEPRDTPPFTLTVPPTVGTSTMAALSDISVSFRRGGAGT
jgi:hypothetical protein